MRCVITLNQDILDSRLVTRLTPTAALELKRPIQLRVKYFIYSHSFTLTANELP